MHILIIISIVFVLVYIYFIAQVTVGWKSLQDSELIEVDSDLFISLIIPFRNEAESLPVLLAAIQAQTHKAFEIILVNDHSTDNSLSAIHSLQPNFNNLQLIDAKGYGKKNALKEGIAKAKGELILTTDADCVPGADWLKSIAQYQENETCDMLICPVKMANNKSLFSKLQALEFTSLVATGAGAAGMKKPIMCNGANLAFTPKAWKESIAELNEDAASGDDMFLMLSIKKRRGKIHFLKSRTAMVETAACKTWSEFLNQRKRWVSKSSSYKDITVILVALLVFGICSLIIANTAVGFYIPVFWKLAILIWLMKTLADSSFLYRTLAFFDKKNLIFYTPILALLYPPYVFYSAISGLFGTYSWKGRRH